MIIMPMSICWLVDVVVVAISVLWCVFFYCHCSAHLYLPSVVHSCSPIHERAHTHTLNSNLKMIDADDVKEETDGKEGSQDNKSNNSIITGVRSVF